VIFDLCVVTRYKRYCRYKYLSRQLCEGAWEKACGMRHAAFGSWLNAQRARHNALCLTPLEGEAIKKAAQLL